MSMLVRSARVVVTTSLALLAAMAAPRAASAAGPVRANGPIGIGWGGGVLPIAPSVQFYEAGGGSWVDMGPESGRICALTGEWGDFDDASRSIDVRTENGEWYLRTSASVSGTAACVNTSAFHGPGTAPLATTDFDSPWWAAASAPGTSTTTMTTSAVNAPPAATWCMLSGIGGDWTHGAYGFDNYVLIENSGQGPAVGGLPSPSYGPWTLTASTQSGPYLDGNANCFAFPNRSSVYQTGGWIGMLAPAPYDPSSPLPSLATAFCALQGVEGFLTDGARVLVTHDSNGNQAASIGGSIEEAFIACVEYAQE